MARHTPELVAGMDRNTQWISQPANTAGFDIVSSIVEDLKSKPEITRRKALDVVRNVAALETGAIEDLYPSDRGLTITAAAGVAILESIASKHGEAARSYLKAALDAYELVLDFSTKATPIAQAWIRNLHTEICKSQETYKVFVSDSSELRPLPKGGVAPSDRTGRGLVAAHKFTG
jgi:hypothetical protein